MQFIMITIMKYSSKILDKYRLELLSSLGYLSFMARIKLSQTMVFQLLWKDLGGQKLIEEHAFHPTRKWRFDFAHELSMVAIEIEGGVFRRGGGAHSHPSGILRDIEKYNEASFLGWSVIRLTEKNINESTLSKTMRHIHSRIGS